MNWRAALLLFLVFLQGARGIALSTTATLVSVRGSDGVYLNPNTGRFHTQDTFEGNNEDPLSLHKYLYSKANPVNLNDPSGHDGSESLSGQLSVGQIQAIAASVTLGSIAIANAYSRGAIAEAAWNATVAAGGSMADAAESALSAYRISVRQLIDEAKEILRQTGQLLKNIKVVPMSVSATPNVAIHVAAAQATGQPIVLTRVLPAVAAANRRAAVAGRGPAGLGQSWDEYPFASGRPPGSILPPSVVAVPWLENSIQGGIIAACYLLEKITPGTPYVVVVTP